MKKSFLTFLSLQLIASLAFAQATQSLSLDLEKIQKGKTALGDAELRMDLLAEAKRQDPNLPQIDLERVEVAMKSGLGGAAAYLLINGSAVDSQSVETDPDLFSKPGGETKVELKNIERRVTTAVLSVIGTASLKSVTLVFGAIQDTVVLGKYANQQANQVANAKPTDEKATSLAVRPPAEIRPLPKSEEGLDDTGGILVTTPEPSKGNGPIVITPPAQQQKQKPPAPRKKGAFPPRDCVYGVCIGDRVTDRYGRAGVVTGIYEFDDLIYVRLNGKSKSELMDPTQVRIY